MFAIPRSPPTEPMSTIAPPSPVRRRCGIAARTVRKTPLRLMSIMSSHIASEMSSAAANEATPASAGNWTRRQVTGRPGSPIGPVLAGQVAVLVEGEQGQPGPSGGERRDRAVDGHPVEGDEAGRAGAEQVGADGRDHPGGREDE